MGDGGKLTDHNGKNVDFRNVILIKDDQCGRLGHGGSRRSWLWQRHCTWDDHEAINPSVHSWNSATGLDAVTLAPGAGAGDDRAACRQVHPAAEEQVADRNVTRIEAVVERPRLARRKATTHSSAPPPARADHPGAHQETARRVNPCSGVWPRAASSAYPATTPTKTSWPSTSNPHRRLLAREQSAEPQNRSWWSRRQQSRRYWSCKLSATACCVSP